MQQLLTSTSKNVEAIRTAAASAREKSHVLGARIGRFGIVTLKLPMQTRLLSRSLAVCNQERLERYLQSVEKARKYGDPSLEMRGYELGRALKTCDLPPVQYPVEVHLSETWVAPKARNWEEVQLMVAYKTWLNGLTRAYGNSRAQYAVAFSEPSAGASFSLAGEVDTKKGATCRPVRKADFAELDVLWGQPLENEPTVASLQLSIGGRAFCFLKFNTPEQAQNAWARLLGSGVQEEKATPFLKYRNGYRRVSRLWRKDAGVERGTLYAHGTVVGQYIAVMNPNRVIWDKWGEGDRTMMENLSP